MQPAAARRPPAARPLPELKFERTLPSDFALALVREQDALYRAVVMVVPVASQVVIKRLEDQHFFVQVTSSGAGLSRMGSARHRELDWAVRFAYSELLRDTVLGARVEARSGAREGLQDDTTAAQAA